ncbi:MAG TPA: glycoside hydrolase family 20 zincin-like fold domain-containing protein [Anaerolineae bacterium]|nr:glycoside hydrolase family 20 zincin-like fold domain-containing protein [Anaerolineae bacterium]
MDVYILPVPKKLTFKKGVYRFSGEESIMLCSGTAPDNYDNARIVSLKVLETKAINSPINRTTGLPEKGCINLVIEKNHSWESYRLDITPDMIVIGSSTPRGLINGMRTFEQILEQTGSTIQCLHIEDSPDFPDRGVYHDVSRGKVPTFETLRMLIEKASRYKLNQFQFYVEHVFAFRSNPEIWAGFDVITPEEILELDTYARSLHIDLVPSLASFGHMYEILQNPVYAHLRDLEDFDPEEYSRWHNRMFHHTIDVSNEESYELLGNMFDDYLPLFSSPCFNICCDETVDLGMGRNKERAEREGVGNLYIGHILRLYEMVKKYNKKIMIWGDILVNHPDLISRLPGDVTLLNWQYRADVTDTQSKLFGENSNWFYNCPGVNGWNRLANDINEGTVNIRKMVTYGKENGAVGILTTDWGDYGHVNPLAGSFHGLVFGASLSWNTGKLDEKAFDRAFSVIELSDSSGRVGSLLRELGSLYTNWRMMIKGINGLTGEDFTAIPENILKKSCRRAPEIAQELIKLRATVPIKRRIDFDEFIWSARAVAINSLTALLARRKIMGNLGTEHSAELIEFSHSVMDLAHDFEALWRARNKESELYMVTEVFYRIAREAEAIARGS